MRVTRPLSVMLYALGWAAIPAWPAGIASALLWTARAELALLSVAGAGTSAALALALQRRAEARVTALAAEYERMEGRLCDALAASLHGGARTPAGLRLLRGAAPPGAPAPR